MLNTISLISHCNKTINSVERNIISIWQRKLPKQELDHKFLPFPNPKWENGNNELYEIFNKQWPTKANLAKYKFLVPVRNKKQTKQSNVQNRNYIYIYIYCEKRLYLLFFLSFDIFTFIYTFDCAKGFFMHFYPISLLRRVLSLFFFSFLPHLNPFSHLFSSSKPKLDQPCSCMQKPFYKVHSSLYSQVPAPLHTLLIKQTKSMIWKGS